MPAMSRCGWPGRRAWDWWATASIRRSAGADTARALRLLAAWASAPVNGQPLFGRLELGAKVGNIASQPAARSGGFSDDGVRLACLRNSDGSFSDEARFALLAPLT